MDLNFEITNIPSWRGDDNNNTPNVDSMLDDILSFVIQWKAEKDKSKYRKKLRKLRVKYIVHTQIEEGIGVQNEDQTADIIDEIEEELQRMHIKRKSERDSYDDSKRKKFDTQSHVILNSHNQSLQLEEDSLNFTLSQSTQEMIENEISHQPDIQKSETVNLYKGLLHLESIIENEQCETFEERKELEQLLEIKNCIQDTHRVLMDGIALPGKTGVFSTCVRKASFCGDIAYYPQFLTETIAEAALQCLTDQYHFQLKKIKELKEKKFDKAVLAQIFRLASIFTFTFLQLHPFSDGNGRLGRLLCSYVLGLFTPFPSPIYNVFANTCKDDFVRILRATMKTIKNVNFEDVVVVTTEAEALKVASNCFNVYPSDLCALIIESNWYMWKELLDK